MARAVDVDGLINDAPYGRYQRMVLLIFLVLGLFDGFDLQLVPMAAPAIAKDWGVSVASFGPIFGAGVAGLLLGSLVLVYIADRWGRKICILIAVTILAVSTVATAWAPSFYPLFVLRFCTGLGIGALSPNVMTLSAECAPRRMRAISVTVMTASLGFGSTVAALVAARTIPQFGWPSIFYIGGVLPLVMIPLVAIYMPELVHFLVMQGRDRERISRMLLQIVPSADVTPADLFTIAEPPLRGFPVLALFAKGRAIKTVYLWTAFVMSELMLFFVSSWLPSILTEEGMPLGRAIFALSFFTTGGIFGAILIGWLADRYRPHRVMVGVYLCGAALFGVIGIAAGFFGVVVTAAFFAGFCTIGTVGGVFGLAASVYPTAMRSTGLGWINGIGRVGSMTGAVIGGLLLATGLPKADLFYLVAVPPLIAAAAMFLMHRVDLRTARS